MRMDDAGGLLHSKKIRDFFARNKSHNKTQLAPFKHLSYPTLLQESECRYFSKESHQKEQRH